MLCFLCYYGNKYRCNYRVMMQVRKERLCEGFCKKKERFSVRSKTNKEPSFLQGYVPDRGKGTGKLFPKNHNVSLHHSVVPLPLGQGRHCG